MIGDAPDDRTSQAREVARAIAAAIARRDTTALRGYLAPGFVHRALGGAASPADAFLAAVAAIPGEIVFVNLDCIDVDRTPAGALVTGIQHARVIVDGRPIDDRRRFVDWFVRSDDGWLLQAAIDLPDQVAER